MSKFTDSEHCRSGAHCRTCRDREGGRAFRRQVARLLGQEGGPDWPCPLGKPWGPPAGEAGFIGKNRGLGDSVAEAIKFVTFGRIKPCGGCQRRQAALNRIWPYR